MHMDVGSRRKVIDKIGTQENVWEPPIDNLHEVAHNALVDLALLLQVQLVTAKKDCTPLGQKVLVFEELFTDEDDGIWPSFLRSIRA